MTYTLFYPIFAMFLLTFAVTLWMGFVRFKAIKGGHVDPRYFKIYQGNAPENMIVASRHFTNLFEVPVVFYAGVILAIVFGVTGTWIHFWAWLFVAARIVQALVHLGGNKITWRMRSYLLGWLALVALWIVLASDVIRMNN